MSKQLSKQLEAPLFRGATKPVMFFGIPINAFLLLTAPPGLVLFMLYDVLGYFSILLLIPVIVGVPAFRQITKQDDQYLNMWMLELRERVRIFQNTLGGVVIIPPKSLRHHRFIED